MSLCFLLFTAYWINNRLLILNETNKIIPKGTILSLWKRLTAKDAKAPKIIFILPIRADALPARFVKGVSDRAVVLGF